MGTCWWWAGAMGQSGAPSMASLAALRAGAGLVTAAVPRVDSWTTVAGVAPELMVAPLQEGRGGRGFACRIWLRLELERL